MRKQERGGDLPVATYYSMTELTPESQCLLHSLYRSEGCTDLRTVPLIDVPWAVLKEHSQELWVWEAGFEF